MFKKFIILTILCFTLVTSGYSQTTLSAGDIAIIAMNCDGNDEFSFVLLTPIAAGTVIKFAESGWLSGGGFRGGGSGSEGTVTWTASSALACGTEVTITSNGTAASSGSTSLTGTWALSSSGDQILAYQGTSGSPTFIYALNNEGAGVWQADATSTNNSALPAGLTNGTNAVALVEQDNQRYDCSTTTPPAAILGAVSNNSNWLSHSSTPYSLPLNCGFTCTACTPSSEPATNATNLTFPDTTCNSIDLNWTNGDGTDRIVVVSTSPITGIPSDQNLYSAHPSYGSGATIAANEYVVYNGSGNSTTVTNLSPTTTYYFAIFEYNGTTSNCDENYLTTGFLTGSFATPACPPVVDPQISGILVNACGGNEGLDEMVTFSTGNSSLPIDSITVHFPNGGSYCNSGCGANTWVTNPTYVAQLNTTAGCPGLFVEADPIPANADIFLFTGATPTYNFDFSGLCGTGPYYVMFANNSSGTGRFSNYNADCSTRDLSIDFGSSYSDTVTYSRCLTANADGDYVQFTPNGTASYQNNGCTPTAILPVTLINFNGKRLKSNKNLLEWSTSTEINNDYFTIEQSNDAINFETIGEINGAGNSKNIINYKFNVDAPKKAINYYRLKQTDFDNNYSYSRIIVIDNSFSDAKIFMTKDALQVNFEEDISNGKIEVIDAVGRVIYSNNVKSSLRIKTTNFNKGIYIVRITLPSQIITEKVKF